jgi:hypothetical protein
MGNLGDSSVLVQQSLCSSQDLFLVIMDELLQRLSTKGCGASICHLYLGGATHADDVRAIASSTSVAEAHEGVIISDFSSENGIRLNRAKTEIIIVSNSTRSRDLLPSIFHYVHNMQTLFEMSIEV